MNKRDAINEILLALNELPLDSSDVIDDLPTAILISKEIDIAKKKVLNYGWKFNELTISFAPNNENNIVIPDTFLTATGTADNPEVIIRDWKAYNKETNSFIFTSSITLEVIDDVAFDDLPFAIANLVVQTASLKSYIDIVGNTEDVAIRRTELKEAKIDAIRYDTRISNTNTLEGEYESNLLNMSSL